MKFTEKQYKTIIDFQTEIFSNNIFSQGVGNYSFPGELNIFNRDLEMFILNNGLGNEFMSLLNPLTRVWAYEQFVEQEKKYYWTNKKADDDGMRLNLDRFPDGIVILKYSLRGEALTESEIREWGYNPEYFDKKEAN